ncbi:hypothetical protein [Streptomyces sp. NPDC051162]|uniref:hypothetical protein n=1 Tax=unclassified Streptomyces TaxID=2593676 RepID=UPI00342AE0A3
MIQKSESLTAPHEDAHAAASEDLSNRLAAANAMSRAGAAASTPGPSRPCRKCHGFTLAHVLAVREGRLAEAGAINAEKARHRREAHS